MSETQDSAVKDHPETEADRAAQHSGRSQRSFSFVFLTAATAVSLAAAFYAITFTATSDQSVRPYAAALAIGLAVVLILYGLIDVNRAEKGMLVSTLTLLPKIHAWGIERNGRAIVLGLLMLMVGGLSIWLGPMGTRAHTVECDAAAEIQFSSRSERMPCEGVVAQNIWLTPLQRSRKQTLSCFDKRSNRWDGTMDEHSMGRCGARPLDASFVTSGIDHPVVDADTVSGQRMTAGLARLRSALSNGYLPDRRLTDRLLFATWNIRDLGSNKFGYGNRLDESYAYIAEVISHFDVVAVQELQDREALSRILDLLGGDYRAEFSFVAPGPSGNRERLGFIYDSRKVAFGDISTTIVFDRLESSSTGQPARPPFMAEFLVNNRRFFAVTAHAYYGSNEGPKIERRIAELEVMARGLSKMLERDFPEYPTILAGDLTVSKPTGKEMEALLSNGFETEPHLASLNTSFTDRYPYDQIMIWSANADKLAFGRLGVFKVFDHVFRSEEWEDYRVEMRRLVSDRNTQEMNAEQLFIERFRTWQISDHHVKWAEFRIDW